MMTCKEIREQQLDELKDGIDELTYFVEVLGRGTFNVIERYSFESIQEAKECYRNLIKPYGPYYPGFVRKYAKVIF